METLNETDWSEKEILECLLDARDESRVLAMAIQTDDASSGISAPTSFDSSGGCPLLYPPWQG